MKDKIRKTIAKFLSVDEKKIKDETGPGDLAEWDSLAHQGLILELEKVFKLKLEIDDVLEMESLEDIVEIIENKIKI
jgi:acyl carrier protein